MGVDHTNKGGSMPTSGAKVSKTYVAESLTGVGIGGDNSVRNKKCGVGDGTLLNNSNVDGLKSGKVITKRRYDRIMRRLEKKQNK